MKVFSVDHIKNLDLTQFYSCALCPLFKLFQGEYQQA
jgi:hypothetical protein